LRTSSRVTDIESNHGSIAGKEPKIDLVREAPSEKARDN
jgi:hypothetical protein